jgi:hypothetical protein
MKQLFLITVFFSCAVSLPAQLSLYPILGIEADTIKGNAVPFGPPVEQYKVMDKWIDTKGYVLGGGLSYEFISGFGIGYEWIYSGQKSFKARYNWESGAPIPIEKVVYNKTRSNLLLNWKFKNRIYIASGLSTSRYSDLVILYLDDYNNGSGSFMWEFKELGIPIRIGGRLGPVWISLEYNRSRKYIADPSPESSLDPSDHILQWSRLKPIHTASVNITYPLEFKSTKIPWEKIKWGKRDKEKSSKINCPKI